MSNTCCTCARLIPSSPTLSPISTKTEKPIPTPPPRTLPCCTRLICGSCQTDNPRFKTYCPFCQISTTPSALPSEGLRLPPSYTELSQRSKVHDSPPAYDTLSSTPRTNPLSAEPPKDTRDTIHHLSLSDTLPSLSLTYRTPIHVLQSHNRISTPHLLSAHKWILIPASHYNGPPLSSPPDPIEEERKNKLRRWMIATKCADYEVAGLYLKGSDYDLEIAVEAWRADERWEREHPMREGERAKQKKRGFGGGGSLSEQLA